MEKYTHNHPYLNMYMISTQNMLTHSNILARGLYESHSHNCSQTLTLGHLVMIFTHTQKK